MPRSANQKSPSSELKMEGDVCLETGGNGENEGDPKRSDVIESNPKISLLAKHEKNEEGVAFFRNSIEQIETPTVVPLPKTTASTQSRILACRMMLSNHVMVVWIAAVLVAMSQVNSICAFGAPSWRHCAALPNRLASRSLAPLSIRSSSLTSTFRSPYGSMLYSTKLDKDDEDDDDGWGDPPASIDENDDKTRELRRLQQERSAAAPTSVDRTTPTEEPERDLFIPIFAVVSILGLFGSYGYEMLRLYSRGELYLPFGN